MEQWRRAVKPGPPQRVAPLSGCGCGCGCGFGYDFYFDCDCDWNFCCDSDSERHCESDCCSGNCEMSAIKTWIVEIVVIVVRWTGTATATEFDCGFESAFDESRSWKHGWIGSNCETSYAAVKI